MRIITIPNQDRFDFGEATIYAMLVYVTKSMVIVNYFGKNGYCSLFPNDKANNASLEQFKDYLSLTNQVASIKQSVKNCYRSYIGYTCKLHQIDDQFKEADDDYVFLGHAVMTYDVYKRRQDFAMYVTGYDYNTTLATMWRPRFAETKQSQDTLFLWEGYNYVCGMAYLICPSSALELSSDENVLIVRNTEQTVIRCEEQTTIEQGTDDQYHFYIQPEAYFPHIEIECSDVVQTDSIIKVGVKAFRKVVNGDTRTITVTDQLINYPIKLYFESSAGYLPINRIETTNGYCEFELITNGVPKDTMIDLKVNGKNFTRLGSKTIQVM